MLKYLMESPLLEDCTSIKVVTLCLVTSSFCNTISSSQVLALSAQNLHSLQSSDLQLEQCPHLLHYFPNNKNYTIIIKRKGSGFSI